MKKNQQKISYIILLIILVNNCFSQFQFTPLTTNNFGRTDPNIQGVGVGVFPPFTPTNSRFHINNFLCNQPNGALNGLLFRSDGNSTVDNNWQLFTGTAANNVTEKFRLTALANTNDVALSTMQSGRMLFNTNGFTLMSLEAGGGLNGGRLSIGNNLPVGFVPQARVHIHQIGGNPIFGNNTYIRFTNNITGPTATDGFAITIDEKSNAIITNNETNLILNAPNGQIVFTDATTSISSAEIIALKNEVENLKAELLQLKTLLVKK